MLKSLHCIPRLKATSELIVEFTFCHHSPDYWEVTSPPGLCGRNLRLFWVRYGRESQKAFCFTFGSHETRLVSRETCPTLYGIRQRGKSFKKPSFVAPTPGLGNAYFGVGKGVKTGSFQETLKMLSSHARMNFKLGAADVHIFTVLLLWFDRLYWIPACRSFDERF